MASAKKPSRTKSAASKKTGKTAAPGKTAARGGPAAKSGKKQTKNRPAGTTARAVPRKQAGTGDRVRGQGLGPIIDDVKFPDLFERSTYEVLTDDGWTLIVTRYRPIPQGWHQPLLDTPMLLVHGFSQNRHAWTAGEFVKDMLYFGADLHIVELRGHGLSSIELQRQKEREGLRGVPDTIDFSWDFSHYFLYDVPAVIDAVKEVTGRDKVAYCGHSMGGMIGYGLASQRDDLLCLATIGSPADLGAEALWIRLAGVVGGFVPLLQAIVRMADEERVQLFEAIQGNSTLSKLFPWTERPSRLNPDVLPMDWILGSIYRTINRADNIVPDWIPKEFRVFDPAKEALQDLRWMIKEGGEREPVKVMLTFMRWIRGRELICYQSGYDFKANFHKITIPLTIVFGDEDLLAGMKSTRVIYENARSDYLVWRPVRGNSHIEITMGYDIRQICYDIKNLMEFAVSHQDKPSRLPRRPLHRRNLLKSVRRGRKRRQDQR